MKKPVQVALIVVVVALAGVCAVLYSRYQDASNKLAVTESAESEIRDRYGRTIEAIAEIQDSLSALSLEETGAQLAPGGERSAASTEEALARIAALRSSIDASKERIRKLEGDLKASGTKVAGLSRLIDNLKKSVVEKEAQVAVLSARVDSLNTEVSGLTVAVAQKDDTLRTRTTQLEQKRRDIATIWYVIGNKQELEEAGVIETRGGVLGLGKTIVPSPNPNAGVFMGLDTDHLDTIRIPAPKAKIVSAQPVTSYELRPVDGALELRILDPVEFRRIRQVVILTG
jgi:flagellar biosynthesis chaperone FliJ